MWFLFMFSGEADRTPLFSQQGGLDPETSMIGKATAGVEEEVLDNQEDTDWLTRTEKARVSQLYSNYKQCLY
ncbi:hypothetical protein P5673_024038, partial [Acropora cervicornis]